MNFMGMGLQPTGMGGDGVKADGDGVGTGIFFVGMG